MDTTVNALKVLVGFGIVAVDVVAVSDEAEMLPVVNVTGDTVVMDDEFMETVEKVDVNNEDDADADSKVGGTVVVTFSDVIVAVDVVAVNNDGMILVSDIV